MAKRKRDKPPEPAAARPGVEIFPTLTDEALRELALKYVQGQVSTSADVPAELCGMVFMPLMFATNEQREAWIAAEYTLAYAVFGEDKTFGQAINGHAIFASCRLMTRKDCERFAAAVVQAEQAVKGFIKGT